MRLFKKNKGLAILEFVLVLPLFLVVISCINDIASLIRVKGTLESLAASVVNVPFQVVGSSEVVDTVKFKNNLIAATRAFVATYRMYSVKASKRLVFCWSGIEFRDGSPTSDIVLKWRFWLQDSKGDLKFTNNSLGTQLIKFENNESTVIPKNYKGALMTGVGAALVLEVFLDISEDMQFINFFKMFSMDKIRVKVFAIPKSTSQMPNLLDSSE